MMVVRRSIHFITDETPNVIAWNTAAIGAITHSQNPMACVGVFNSRTSLLLPFIRTDVANGGVCVRSVNTNGILREQFAQFVSFGNHSGHGKNASHN